MEDSLLINIPKGVKLSRINNSRISQVIINMEAYSQLVYINQSHIELLEAHLDHGAHLYFVNLDRTNHNIFDGTSLLFSLKEDAVGELFFVDLLEKGIKRDIKISLLENNASSKIRGICLLNENDLLQYDILQEHKAPFTSSNLVYKGILKDDAKLKFKGEIVIEKEANASDAYQSYHALTIGENPTLEVIPILEIKNNDIRRCTHGTTIGKIDEEIVFYMSSRGLDEKDILRLISKGFLGDLINEIPINSIKVEILESLEGILEA
ncbi:MAG: SufD family Fe-S cluster assembly protein [bacterium]